MVKKSFCYSLDENISIIIDEYRKTFKEMPTRSQVVEDMIKRGCSNAKKE